MLIQPNEVQGGSDPVSESIFLPTQLSKDSENLDMLLEKKYFEDPQHLLRFIDAVQFKILLGRRDRNEDPTGWTKMYESIEEKTEAYELLEAWRQKAHENIGSLAVEKLQEK